MKENEDLSHIWGHSNIEIQGKTEAVHPPYLTFDQGWKTLGKEMLTAHDEAISILVNLLCPQDFQFLLSPVFLA